jgi:hypothetical protein
LQGLRTEELGDGEHPDKDLEYEKDECKLERHPKPSHDPAVAVPVLLDPKGESARRSPASAGAATVATADAPCRDRTRRVQLDRHRWRQTRGSWVDDGGVVVEAAFADALGVRAGDHVTLDGRSFRVAGVAVTAAAPPYPSMAPPGTPENRLQYCPLPSPSPCDQPPAAGHGPSPELEAALRRVDAEHPGLVWLTQTDARSLAPHAESLN